MNLIFVELIETGEWRLESGGVLYVQYDHSSCALLGSLEQHQVTKSLHKAVLVGNSGLINTLGVNVLKFCKGH